MEVRKGTIKKPKFIPTYVVSVVIMLVVLFVLAFLLLLPEVAIYTSEAEDQGSEYENDLENCFFNLMDKEEITAEDLNKVKAEAVVFYAETGSKCKIKIDGYGEFDSSKTAMLDYSYWTDNNDMDTHRTVVLMLADNKYLEYFFTPEVMEYYVPAYNGEEYYPKGLELQFSCTEFYADLEKGLFIPVEVDICKDTGYTNFLPTGIKIHIEPDNTEGYTLYHSTNHHTEFEKNTTQSVNAGSISGCDGPVTDEECDGFYRQLVSGEGLRYEIIGQSPVHIPFTTTYKKELTITVIAIIWLAFAFAFIPATISYNIKKRRFEIFEYRHKMVDAMAHDLKTPMAAILAYSENLSNNIATDKKEYYAGKIQEKVTQMNKMVNDILEFSKSENQSAVVAKADVDLCSVISRIISDNEHAITERSLKVNFESIYFLMANMLIGNGTLFWKMNLMKRTFKRQEHY